MPSNEVLRLRQFALDISKKTQIMGVMNLTPDSFSQDGRFKYSINPKSHFRFANQLIDDGADIIDIGGESTRPGADKISISEEIKRVIPTIRLLSPNCRVPISVDTYKPAVAIEALEAGASLVNTIKGVKVPKSMIKAVARHQAGIVLMHMRGTPPTMQKKTVYGHLIKEIIKDLALSIEFCLENGIKKDRIIVDPGIGFAKDLEGNLEILRRLNEFKVLGMPVLIGTSRKSFIGRILDATVDHRDWGTAASVAVGISKGASIVRVHNVKAMKQVVQVSDAIIG